MKKAPAPMLFGVYPAGVVLIGADWSVIDPEKNTRPVNSGRSWCPRNPAALVFFDNFPLRIGPMAETGCVSASSAFSAGVCGGVSRATAVLVDNSTPANSKASAGS